MKTRSSGFFGKPVTDYNGWQIWETNGKRWGRYFAFSIKRRAWKRITHFRDLESLKAAIDERERRYNTYLLQKRG